MMIFLDWFFVVFHMLVVGINLFGWMHPRTRKLNLITLSITFLSWFGLGLIYGIGYCPLTDWHWQIKERIGETNLPISYVKYYVDKIFSVDSNPQTVDTIVMLLFVAAIIGAIITQVKTRRPPAVEQKND